MVVILFELKKRPEADVPEYRAMLARMDEIVTSMPGYISSEDFISEDGKRDLSIVRFESLEALEASGALGITTADSRAIFRVVPHPGVNDRARIRLPAWRRQTSSLPGYGRKGFSLNQCCQGVHPGKINPKLKVAPKGSPTFWN